MIFSFRLGVHGFGRLGNGHSSLCQYWPDSSFMKDWSPLTCGTTVIERVDRTRVAPFLFVFSFLNDRFVFVLVWSPKMIKKHADHGSDEAL